MNCSMMISDSSRSQDVPASLDQSRMKRTAEGLLLMVEASLPAGCFEWAARCRPDVFRLMAEAIDGARAAVVAGDAGEALAYLDLCIKLGARAAWIYRSESVSGVSEKVAQAFCGGVQWAR